MASPDMSILQVSKTLFQSVFLFTLYYVFGNLSVGHIIQSFNVNYNSVYSHSDQKEADAIDSCYSEQNIYLNCSKKWMQKNMNKLKDDKASFLFICLFCFVFCCCCRCYIFPSWELGSKISPCFIAYRG